MKKRRSFFRRHIIAITFILLVGVYSLTSFVVKEMEYRSLKSDGQQYLERIKELEEDLRAEQRNLEKIDTLKFIEEEARETYKMVRPDEIYFQMTYDKDNKED
jgi:cell division protein FtsB